MARFDFRGTRVVNAETADQWDVFIGCGANGTCSLFGNPFTQLPECNSSHLDQAAVTEDSVARFEEWVFTQPRILSEIWGMLGKSLGCTCAPRSCHCSIYVYLVATYVWMRDSGTEPRWTTEAEIAELKRYYGQMKRYLQGEVLPAKWAPPRWKFSRGKARRA